MFLVQKIDTSMGILFPESIVSHVYNDVGEAFKKFEELMKAEDEYYNQNHFTIQDRDEHKDSEYCFEIGWSYDDCEYGTLIRFEEV